MAKPKFIRIHTLVFVFASLTFGLNPVSSANTTESSNDQIRAENVSAAITALQAYAISENSYTVSGSGYENIGLGWFHYVGGVYQKSIAEKLIELGFLSTPAPQDPELETPGAYSRFDFLVFRCRDRVAVFSISDGIQPTSEDSQWWSANNCTRYPIDALNHDYFQLSERVIELSNDQDDQNRISSIATIIEAFESFSAANASYQTPESGYDNVGIGWFHLQGGKYETSIASKLVELGYLSSPGPQDPKLTNPGKYSRFDFLVYRCIDRVAVFSVSDGIESTTQDSSWWEENNCNRSPIEKLNHPYFQLSGPIEQAVSDTEYDSIQSDNIDTILAALENYGTDNESYLIDGAGHSGNGQGWFHYQGGKYVQSISTALVSQGFLDSPPPVDPFHKNPGDYDLNDYLIFRCKNRIAVFAKAKFLETSDSDSEWWGINNCTRFPIDNLEHEYFKISEPLLPKISAPDLQNYRLVFNDEFNGGELDAQKWDTGLLWGPYFPINNEEQMYVDTLGMHSNFSFTPFEFTGSSLKINATPTSEQLQPPTRPPEDSADWKPRYYSEYRYNGPTENGPGYLPADVNYLSGIITTYESFKMTHGYVEMRAKLPSGRGLWPAFWLLNSHYVEDVPEIDVVEFLGQDVDRVYHTYHYFDIENNWSKVSTPSYTTFAEDWTAEFHKFGMAWSPTEIIFYIDGQETRRVTDQEFRIANQSMYLIANLAVGGEWPGAPDETTTFPSTFEIDYIRAYDRNLDSDLNLARDYQLMFQDEFEDPNLDPLKWNTSFLWGPYLDINEEEQYYVDALGSDMLSTTDANSPFLISNGVLSIVARENTDSSSHPIPSEVPNPDADIWANFPTYQQSLDYSPGSYTSGIITSYDSFKFVNGYAEMRARIPQGQGLWPAFWLLNGYYVGPQPEIDVLEVLGQNANLTYHTYHRLGPDGNQISTQGINNGVDSVKGYSDGFHTYGVRWQRGRIDWYIDGDIVYTYTGDDVPYQAMYVIANLAVGGTWPGSPDSTTTFPASFDIDYIKVYQERHKED